MSYHTKQAIKFTGKLATDLILVCSVVCLVGLVGTAVSILV